MTLDRALTKELHPSCGLCKGKKVIDKTTLRGNTFKTSCYVCRGTGTQSLGPGELTKMVEELRRYINFGKQDGR